MAETALERTERALDLIPFISKNPGWSIAALAEKFNTSPSQIMNDLEMLFMCGLPGYSHLELIDLEIDEDYVAVRNAQNLDSPRKLTYPEVVALLLGLDSLMNQIIDSQLLDRATQLRKTLSSFLGGQSSIASVVNERYEYSHIDILIQDAIKNGSALEIQYRSSRTDSMSERTIFPRSLYFDRGHLYTIAFCQKAGELRHFRNDRITRGTPIVDLPEPQILATSEAQILDQVVAELSTLNRFFIEENPSIISSTHEEGEHLLVTFEIADLHWLSKALISLPGPVQVISPVSFRDLYNAKLDAILDLYR
jgi:proteasome accessory factor C